MAKDIQKELPKLSGAFGIKECAYCTKEFIGWYKTRYCSIECRKTGFVQKRKGLGINKNCKQCNKEFYVSLSAKRQIYCSCACRDEAKKIRISKVCPTCQSKFEVKKSWNRVKYCSTHCYHKAMRTRHSSPDAIVIKRQMRKQGLIEKCNRCAYNSHIGILVIHHIDRDRQNNSLDNIEVLCPNCHAIEHYVKPIEGITLSVIN